MSTFVSVALRSESSDHYCLLAEVNVARDLFVYARYCMGDELAWCYVEASDFIGDETLADRAVQRLIEGIEGMDR